MKKPQRVLVICAHSDDQIFGPGGTLAKYAQEGAAVRTVILSYGVLSHPHMDEEVISKVREREARKADKVIGGQNIEFLDLKEGNFLKSFKTNGHKKKLQDIIKQFKPDRIFTHSPIDSHKDHRDTNKLVLETLDNMRYKCEVFTFEVWTFLTLREPKKPRLIVDVSDTMAKKIQALNCFRSQIRLLGYQQLNNLLFLHVYIKALLNGIRYNTKYVEVFRKVR